MKDARPAEQFESIAVRYMNRFAIEEDDQFEIAAIQNVDGWNKNDVIEKLDKAMQAVENLTKQQNQGIDYFHRRESHSSIFSLKSHCLVQEYMYGMIYYAEN